MDNSGHLNTVLQWNCRSLWDKRFKLKHFISIMQPIVICLQETFFLTQPQLDSLRDLFKSFDFYIFNRVRPDLVRPLGGVGIVVHKTVPHRSLQLNTPHEAIAVEALLYSKYVNICSLYLPNRQGFTVDSLIHLSSQLGNHHLILGDFNSHNQLWGSIQTNYRGGYCFSVYITD